jgi:hypothetical protein
VLDASRAAGHFSSWRHPAHMSTTTVNRIGKFAFTPITSWSSKRFSELMCIPGIEVRCNFGEDNVLFLAYWKSRLQKIPMFFITMISRSLNRTLARIVHIRLHRLNKSHPLCLIPPITINNGNFVPDFKASAGFPVVETSVLGLGGPFFSKRCFGCGVRRRRGGHP